MSLSIIVPVHNEAAAIQQVVRDCHRAAAQLAIAYEILVIDDGSSDATVAQLEHSQVRVVHHDSRLGYGAAIESGMKAASYDTVALIDGDGTYDPTGLPGLYEALNRADLIIGCRRYHPWYRQGFRRLVKYLIRKELEWRTGTRLFDFNSGFRVFRISDFRATSVSLPSGFSASTTITVAFACSGRRLAGVPVRYCARSQGSKFHPLRDTWHLLRCAERARRQCLVDSPTRNYS